MAETLAPVVNFLAVLSILVLAGRKPFGAFLQSRSETVKNEMGEAEKASEEASKMLNEWSTKHKNQEAYAKQSVEETKAALLKFKDKTLAAAKTEAERIKSDAQKMGSHEVLQAKEMLQREIAEKSVNMAEQFLGKQLDPKDKSKLVAEYVELVSHATPG